MITVNEFKKNRTCAQKNGRGFTLVETMVSFAVFTVICLGAISLLTFSLTTMESAKTVTQVSKILSNEMEAMRMRGWNDRIIKTDNNKSVTLYGLHTLGTGKRDSDNKPLLSIKDDTEEPTGPSKVTQTNLHKKVIEATTTYKVHPYAVYGATDAENKKAATLGKEITTGTDHNQKKLEKHKVLRKVTLKQSKKETNDLYNTPEADYAEIIITVNWEDSRGTHKRSLTSYLSKNGLSDLHYRSLE